MDFTSLIYKYNYTTLSMSSGLFFSVNSIVRTSLTDANDFYFAGKARSLTDGSTAIQKFQTSYGYVMKGNTSDSNINCFSFSSGYSLSLKNPPTVPFDSSPFTIYGINNAGSSFGSLIS